MKDPYISPAFLLTVAEEFHDLALRCIVAEQRVKKVISIIAPELLVTEAHKEFSEKNKLLEQLSGCRIKGENITDTFWRQIIYEAGALANWNQRDMSDIIGITPRVLNYQMRKFKLRPKDNGNDETTHQVAS